MQDNPWQTTRIQEVYDNPWIQLTHRDVITPTGTNGIYGVVHFKNRAIGIIPIDEAGNTWLVGQYRYTLGKYSWEIPEGGGPLDQDVLASAKRELLEETGITADRWLPILEADVSNSVTDEVAYAFIATHLQFGDAQPEETEQLQVRKLPLTKAIDMAISGEISDALAIMALLKTKVLLDNGLMLY
jgi:8-oxo-dGTP pyrophosphatase MutT (NUDIX family)